MAPNVKWDMNVCHTYYYGFAGHAGSTDGQVEVGWRIMEGEPSASARSTPSDGQRFGAQGQRTVGRPAIKPLRRVSDDRPRRRPAHATR